MSRLIVFIVCLSLFQMSCSKTEDIPESLLWINGTHAILTKVNGADINRFGTMAPSGTNRTRVRNTLENSWDITTKEDLDYMIDSLVIGRHNQQFLEEAEEYGITGMNREQFENELSLVDSREAIMFFRNMYNAYHGFRDKAIMGWDLSRATQLCAFGYIAEFYTYDEAIDKALAIGRIIQSTFTTWDTFYTSYFFGYAYWSEDDLEDPNSNYSQRVRIFYNLKEDPKSPLNLDWNLELIRE